MSTNQQSFIDSPAVVKTRERTKHVADIAKAQAIDAAVLSSEAAKSGAYVYPLKGVVYFASHPRLWKPVAKPLFFSFMISIPILIFLFTFTYLPQAAFLAIFSGPLGFISAVPLILNEASTIVLFIARLFWLGPALEDTFDHVLLLRGYTSLVSQGREIVSDHHHGKDIGKMLSRPLDKFSKENVIRYIISLPLNAIPLVGTVFFLGWNGAKAGPAYHNRYFQLKQFSKQRQADWVQQHHGAYMAFGMAALALNLIPFGAVIFSFTSAAGAAIWAADEEARAGAMRDVSAIPPEDRNNKSNGAGREL